MKPALRANNPGRTIPGGPIGLRFLPRFALLLAQPASDGLTSRKILFTTVPRTDVVPAIDGDVSDPCWRQARTIGDFQLTAGARGNPVRCRTTVWLLFDDTRLYVAFECLEPDVAGLKVGAKLPDDPDIEFDDRVEVFLDVDHDHRHYWELAVNPAGAQFDQAAFYRLHGSRTCDFFPEQNLFWRAKTKVGTDRWTAEIAIDVTSLGLPRLEEGATWGFNLARARRPDVQKGDEPVWDRRPGAGAEYSAWAPVQDYIKESISNFHMPLEFGDLVFGEPGFAIEGLRLPSACFTFEPVGRATEFGWNPLDVRLRTPDGAPRELAVVLSVAPPTAAGWQERRTVTFRPGAAERLRYYVPEAAENRITLQLLDPTTGRQLYRTAYVETAPPFIEFDLEPLYTRTPPAAEPVRFRLLTDAATRAAAALRLALRAAGVGAVVPPAVVDDLAGADRFTPVFDRARLRALPGGDYTIDCRLVEKNTGRLLGAFAQALTKPAPELPATFSAARTAHSFGGISTDAIRVQFPFAAQFVFWRGACYVPWWEMDGAVMSNEFIECWGGGNQGCNEPMQDRECRYSSVELLESSPARAVVHWRYALNDAHYRIYHNEWVDEYFVLYPDGCGVRQVDLWVNSTTDHEVFETLIVKPPGARTAQMLDDSLVTLSRLDGRRLTVPAFAQNPARYDELVRNERDFILEVDFRHRLHPFTVFSLRDDLLPGVTPEKISAGRTRFENSDQRGHWPASLYAIDGYNAVGLDRPTHFGLGNIHMDVDPAKQPNTYVFLIGAAAAGSDTPRAQAQAWLHPAAVNVLHDSATFRGYDVAERAYRFTVAPGAKRIEVQLEAPRGDVFHPVFLFDQAAAEPARVSIAGRPLAAHEFATARTRAGGVIVFLNTLVGRNATVICAFE